MISQNHYPIHKKGNDIKPSIENMRDNETGDALYQRADDTCEALPKRLKAYHEMTEPILGHYKSICHEVDASGVVDVVIEEALRVYAENH